MIIVQIINLYYNNRCYQQDFSRDLQTNYPLYLLNIAILCDCVGHFLNLMHFFVYSYNGVGIYLFSVLNTIILHASQYIVSSIVLLIGQGWTITFMNIEQIDDVAVPMLLLFGLLNMIIQVHIFNIILYKGNKQNWR